MAKNIQKQQGSTNKTGVFIGIAVFIGLVSLIKKKPPKGDTPVDWNGGANANAATIDYNQALKIADGIKKAVGYFAVSWTDISKEFLKLRNDKDVEMLYRAFGKWDGPKFVNGDLFNALNAAFTPYVDNILGNEQALKIIKQYSFSYGKYFQW